MVDDAKPDRFVLRPDRRGWTVYELWTGEPAVIALVPQTGLSQPQASAGELQVRANTAARAGVTRAKGFDVVTPTPPNSVTPAPLAEIAYFPRTPLRRVHNLSVSRRANRRTTWSKSRRQDQPEWSFGELPLRQACPMQDRFLSARTRTRSGARLGRAFSVVRQTWLTADDPRRTKPNETALATHRTASDAADFARDAATAFGVHGFHKPSGAWWASEGDQFHRFLVAPDRSPRAGPVLVGVGIAALALTALGAVLTSRRNPGRDES